MTILQMLSKISGIGAVSFCTLLPRVFVEISLFKHGIQTISQLVCGRESHNNNAVSRMPSLDISMSGKDATSVVQAHGERHVEP